MGLFGKKKDNGFEDFMYLLEQIKEKIDDGPRLPDLERKFGLTEKEAKAFMFASLIKNKFPRSWNEDGVVAMLDHHYGMSERRSKEIYRYVNMG